MAEHSGSAAWRTVRLLRSRRPGEIAAKGDRKRAFGMALEQGEQLWRAAAVTDTSVSPMMLYYGLMQGGFALSAARTADDSWRLESAHGLKAICPRPDASKVQDLDNITVKPSGNGGIHTVAKVLDSPVLARATSLAEIACSLPQVEELLPDYEHPRPLRVHDIGDGFFRQHLHHAFNLRVGPIPQEMADRLRQEAPGQSGYSRPTLDEVTSWLEPYPTLTGLGQSNGLPQCYPDLTKLSEGGHPPLLQIEWRLNDEMNGRDLHTFLCSHLDVDQSTGGQVAGLAVPAVAGNSRPQHPLVAWWTLLFGFSMVARYHPETWVDLLNVDLSEQAVPIEVLLNRAAAEVPELLFTEIAAALDDE